MDATYDSSCDQLYICLSAKERHAAPGPYEVLSWMRFDRIRGGEDVLGIEIDSAVAHGIDLMALEQLVKDTKGKWTEH